MSVFESLNDTSNQAVDKGEAYLQKSQEYYKLKIFQQLTSSLSLVLKALLIGGLLLIGLVFLAVSSAIAIGNALDSIALGFVIVGALFLVLSGIIYLLRKHINNTVIKTISKSFFD
ncbi:hypothetical protein [Olleya aquimaris]|uniref:Putative superfamily III holin-X n=1 Tax=Olleya aquimaris TaxID=639310 RepID=A0A327RK67_9FLAO|nr:hypothetical protein [Olleya aquimaris]RAJ16811.1 putative superfamily III holin-X [Olleya aquimaris]